MEKIKTINDEKELKKVFNFISKTFYDDAMDNNEQYFIMGDRFLEMKEQLLKDKQFLMYIEKDNQIIAALTSKNIDVKEKKITMQTLSVKREERKCGYAEKLVNEFEKRCREKGIQKIELGARYKAADFYSKLNYRPSLIVQVYDFSNIEDIRKMNIFGLKEVNSFQNETYGFILYEIDEIDIKYVNHFNKSVLNSNCQYIFTKILNT